MESNHTQALVRVTTAVRAAMEQQSTESQHDAIVTLHIMARSVLRILQPIVSSTGFERGRD